MIEIIKNYLKDNSLPALEAKLQHKQQVKRQVDALFDLMTRIYGSKKLLTKAEELNAKTLIHSNNLMERTQALQKHPEGG